MVIETFDAGADAVYRCFAEKGRMLPAGLLYIGSWTTVDRHRCFQVMSTEDPALLQQWMACWSDLVSFEIVPVSHSEEVRQRFLDAGQVSTSSGS